LPSNRPHDSAIIIEYGFRQTHQGTLIHPEQKPLTIAIYEMLDSAAAYGLFTYLRTPTPNRLPESAAPAQELPGKSAFIRASTMSFWSRKSADRLRRQPCFKFARQFPIVAERLFDSDGRKQASNENRVARSEKFLMGAEASRHTSAFGRQGPIWLSTGAERRWPSMSTGGESATLLLIHYPTQQLARRMLESGYRQYSVSAIPARPLSINAMDPWSSWSWPLHSPELATTLLEKVSYVSMVSWDPKVEPPSIGQVMVNIFIFCGIMLGITFAAGFLFGIVRIVIKRFFPGKIFDRPESMEVIGCTWTRKR
jgi:hypothetical protein